MSSNFFVCKKTIGREASFSGRGLFTGAPIHLKLKPAPVDTGIVFRRIDLSGAPTIQATLNFVRETHRSTKLEQGTASVLLVEHVLSALAGCEIDNLILDIDGPELPAGDGSAKVFVECVEKAGLLIQEKKRKVLSVSKPLFWSEKETHIVALPSDEFRISYTLHYPHSFGSQYASFLIQTEIYKTQIAPCRTFVLYEEIAPLIEKGLLKNATLENGVVIKAGKAMNPEGIRFPDELVRHKVLDLIGDLYLLGKALKGHIIAIRSGHSSNVAFAKHLEANESSC